MWAPMLDASRAQLMRNGSILLPSEYQETPIEITRALIEDGRRHLLLRGLIEIGCPTRLLHGMADADVPWQTSLQLAERLTSTDVTVALIKDGDHRLSREQDLRRLFAAIDELSQ